MDAHVKEQRMLILFAHFITEWKPIISLSSSFQSQVRLIFFPSLVCLCFSIIFHILVFACKVLETDPTLTSLFPYHSFPLAQSDCTISTATFIFSPLMLWEGGHFLSNHSPKVWVFLVFFVCLFIFFFLKSIDFPQEADSCRAKWIRTLVILPWRGFSFPSSIKP